MSLMRVQVAQGGFVMPRGATTLPQTTVKSLFTVNSGAIEIMQISGIVTTAIQAQANNTKLQAKATGQTAVDLCAVGDINGLAVGQVVGIAGVLATALQMGWAIIAQSTRLIVLPGTIDLNCAASSTGAFRWVLRWLPVDPGAFVTLS